MQEKLRILKNLEGVNKEAFDSNILKHLASIEVMTEDELIQNISIYDEHGISYVKESGIVEFSSLARTTEEALEFAKKNSNIVTIEEYSSGRKVA